MSENQVLRKLEGIREKGNIKDLDFLFDCLLNENKEIVGKSTSILVDIKLKEANKVIVTKLKDEKYNDVFNAICSVCWQSSLDFSDYILLFFDLVVKKDILVSIEAMSVIENILTGNVYDKDKLQRGMKILKDFIKKSDDEVKKLMISDFLVTHNI